MKIVLISKSKVVGQRDVLLQHIASAVEFQINKHAAPAWDRAPSWRVMVGTRADEGSFPLYILDTPDQEGALGYHTEDSHGKVYGRVFTKPVMDGGGTLLDGPQSVSAVVSHEALELWGDPHCNRWADGPDGKAYALELCDAVENDAYKIDVPGASVSVSNFCTMAWFDRCGKGSVDYMGKLKTSFRLTPGGYVVYRKDGAEHEVFGSQYPAWRLRMRDALKMKGRKARVVR